MTPIYVPEALGVSYADIFTDVCMRLDNDLEPRSAEFAGDGIAEILHLPDRALCAGVNAPLVYTLDDAGVTDVLTEGSANDYSVDYQAGYITLTTDIDTDRTLYIDYKVRHWSEQLLWRLINNGLHWLYPRFYSVVKLTPTADSGGDYPLLDPAGRVVGGVIDVEDVGLGTVHLTPFRDYRVLRDAEEDVVLRVFSAIAGTLTVRAAVHPMEFVTEATSLADIGLPDRMREPLVLYTCWQAITQKMPARGRIDNVTTQAQEGKTTFFDQARMVQVFKMLLDTELQQNHMRSWMAKGL